VTVASSLEGRPAFVARDQVVPGPTSSTSRGVELRARAPDLRLDLHRGSRLPFPCRILVIISDPGRRGPHLRAPTRAARGKCPAVDAIP